jgi:hypothetical protein
MFSPSGEQPMQTTSAPSSWNTLGAMWYAAPCAPSTTIVSPLSVSRLANVLLQNSM